MTDLEAIEKRVSRRTYLGEPIGEEDAAVFEEMIARFNEESGLQIQLVRDGSKAFEGFRRCYGMFSNVRSYFAMVGKYADLYLNEKIGYYGEKLVLEATKRGLGTCWVGGTFDRKACPCQVKSGWELPCVITVGAVSEDWALKERVLYKLIHRPVKRPEQILSGDAEAPDWVREALPAVCLAPSSLSRHPVTLRWQGGKLSAAVPTYADHQSIDLGIAKLHFALASQMPGTWSWGNGSAYRTGLDARPEDAAAERGRTTMRELRLSELQPAARLMEETFADSVISDFSPEGAASFRAYIAQESLQRMVKERQLDLWGCFEGNRLVGVLGFCAPDRVALLFVRKQFQHQGIGTQLVGQAQQLSVDGGLTVHAAPSAVGAYRQWGFAPQGEEQETDGIRYLPMARLSAPCVPLGLTGWPTDRSRRSPVPPVPGSCRWCASPDR